MKWEVKGMDTEQALNEIRRSARKAASAQRRADGLLAERDALVKRAIAAGLSHGQVAKAAGVARSRPGQIAARR